MPASEQIRGPLMRFLQPQPKIASLIPKIAQTHGGCHEAYLARRVERYDAFSWVNDNLPEDAVVMTFDPRSYFIDRPTFQNFEVLESLRPLPVEEQMDWFEERNITYIFYPEAYILESPAYAARGFSSDLEKWRSDPRHFALVERLELSRPGGRESVEIYRIQYDGGPGAPVSDGDVSP